MSVSLLARLVAPSQRERVLLRAQSSYDGPVEGHPDKLAAIREAVQVFDDGGVDYALIGGLAVGIRSGIPRATLDVDFAVVSTVDRGWLTDQFTRGDFSAGGQFAHSVNLRHESGEPVQLAFDAGFDPMILRAERIDLGGLAVRVVTTVDLIAMKRRAAADPARRRSKALRDQADIALLEGDVPDPDEGW